MKKEEFLQSLKVILTPVYESIGKVIDLTAPCPDCGKPIGVPGYVFVKLTVCSECDRILMVGASDSHVYGHYDTVR